MANEEWISLREFSRRREVALSAVQKAIDSGRVTAVKRDANGRLIAIEFHQATEQWNRHTDPVEAAKSGKVLAAPADAAAMQTSALAGAETHLPGAGQLNLPAAGEDPAPASGDTKGSSSTEDKSDYYQHRAKRELYAALREEREHLVALGVLVSAAEVSELAHRRYRAIRDTLLNIPDRQAAILAAEKDPARVHAILTAEIKRVLHELSDDAAASAARGIAERVAA